MDSSFFYATAAFPQAKLGAKTATTRARSRWRYKATLDHQAKLLLPKSGLGQGSEKILYSTWAIYPACESPMTRGNLGHQACRPAVRSAKLVAAWELPIEPVLPARHRRHAFTCAFACIRSSSPRSNSRTVSCAATHAPATLPPPPPLQHLPFLSDGRPGAATAPCRVCLVSARHNMARAWRACRYCMCAHFKYNICISAIIAKL